MDRSRFHPFTALCCAAIAGATFLLTGMRPAPGGITSEQFEILQHMSLVKLPDGLGGLNLTVRFSDVNLQLVNGDGVTDSTDGTGNLVLGYAEHVNPVTRSGSHNLMVGTGHSYTSYGGVVFGQSNRIFESYATVAGGTGNTADGNAAHVCGGNGNAASGLLSVVGGGLGNEALAQQSSVWGGVGNLVTESGNLASILGGGGNTASGYSTTIGGGDDNTCSAWYATVTGGCGITNTVQCTVVP